MTTLHFHPFPVLHTPRLTLRKVDKSDVNEIFILRSDKRVNEYLDRPLATNVDDVLAHIEILHTLEEINEGITWVITLKNDPKLIGNICYWKIVKEYSKAEIGYSLLPAYHRKGIMQEAFTAVLQYGLNVMKLDTIEADVDPKNLPSIKLLERNKFIKENPFSQKYYYKGRQNS
jgi:ribosomal-protein-alanine N-acetyltransferase